MGTLYAFKCKRCRYEAEVSGGPDAGMICETRTIVCRTCRELSDVPVLYFERRPFEYLEPKCRRNRGKKPHDVGVWEHPGACPRCGEELVRVGETCLWD
jgi:hypothetical protein